MGNFISRYFYWINLLWFQLIWCVAVFFTAGGAPFLLFSLLLHFYLTPRRRQDLACLASIALIGAVADLCVSWLGFMVFPEGILLPFWLLLLWAHFAVTLNHGMSWLNKIPLYLQALFGGCFGPLSYYAGSKLGAVHFPPPEWRTLFILIVIWSALLPVYLLLSRIYGARYGYSAQKDS